jgi:hypothetical protein
MRHKTVLSSLLVLCSAAVPAWESLLCAERLVYAQPAQRPTYHPPPVRPIYRPPTPTPPPTPAQRSEPAAPAPPASPAGGDAEDGSPPPPLARPTPTGPKAWGYLFYALPVVLVGLILWLRSRRGF